jgi:hypothetical protein
MSQISTPIPNALGGCFDFVGIDNNSGGDLHSTGWDQVERL